MVEAGTLTSEETIAIFKQYVIPNYIRFPVCLVRGEGSYVWDAEGRRPAPLPGGLRGDERRAARIAPARHNDLCRVVAGPADAGRPAWNHADRRHGAVVPEECLGSGE